MKHEAKENLNGTERRQNKWIIMCKDLMIQF